MWALRGWNEANISHSLAAFKVSNNNQNLGYFVVQKSTYGTFFEHGTCARVSPSREVNSHAPKRNIDATRSALFPCRATITTTPCIIVRVLTPLTFAAHPLNVFRKDVDLFGFREPQSVEVSIYVVSNSSNRRGAIKEVNTIAAKEVV
jgi:hypothetical protein